MESGSAQSAARVHPTTEWIEIVKIDSSCTSRYHSLMIKDVNKAKGEKVVKLVQEYITNLIGENKIWEWIVSERPAWNGGGVELRLKLWNVPNPYELNVLHLYKTCWGMGQNWNGFPVFKFKYTDKCLDNLVNDTTFQYAVEGLVLKHVPGTDLKITDEMLSGLVA